VTQKQTIDGPWAHYGETTGGFYDTPPGFLTPGTQAAVLREEARLQAEEARKESERADRADLRQTAAMMEARQHALARGLRWDPARPFEHMPNIYDRADRLFAAMDAQARRDDRRAAEEAGLVHLLHQGVPSPHPDVEPSSGVPEPPTPESASGSGAAARGRVPLMGDPRTDTSPAGKARRALRRWSACDRRQRFEVNP
jgi:hypothetical protein